MDTNSVDLPRNNRGVFVSYAIAVHSVLVREFGPKRHASKLLARLANVSPRTADNWLQGLCAPRGDELITLMAECDALKEEIFRLVELRKNPWTSHGSSNLDGAALASTEDCSPVSAADTSKL